MNASIRFSLIALIAILFSCKNEKAPTVTLKETRKVNVEDLERIFNLPVEDILADLKGIDSNWTLKNQQGRAMYVNEPLHQTLVKMSSFELQYIDLSDNYMDVYNDMKAKGYFMSENKKLGNTNFKKGEYFIMWRRTQRLNRKGSSILFTKLN